jgi:CheY-like chemotaxis protein
LPRLDNLNVVLSTVILETRFERLLAAPNPATVLLGNPVQSLVSEPLVLLVEDEPLVLLVAQDALEAGGYTVLPVHHASEAIAALDQRARELAGLVTDVRLPGRSDGWEIARHARELRPNLPVVYTTGDSAVDWTVKGVPNSLVVQKPYAAIQLLTAISTLLTKADTGGPS